MKSFTLFLAFIVTMMMVGATLFVVGQSPQPTRTSLGSPLIVSDLSDADSYSATTPFASNRPANWATTFTTAINNFIQTGLTGTTVTFSAPTIVDSKGSFLTTVLAVNDYLTTAMSNSALPPFIVIADSSTVTDQLIIAMRSKVGPSFASIPVFITSTTNDWATSSNNIILLNGNNMNVASNFVELLYGLGQTTLCLLVDADMDGILFERTLMADLARRPKGYPILLKTAYVASGSRAFNFGDAITQSENIALAQLAADPNPCTAVLVAGEGNIAARVMSARFRASSNFSAGSSAALSKMFFYFAPSATARFPDVTGSSINNQILLTPTNFKSVADLASQLSLSAASVNGLTDTWSITVGPVLDAIALSAIAASNSASPQTNGFLNALFTQTLQSGATTPFSISPMTQTRAPSDTRSRLVLIGSASGSATSTVATRTVATWNGPQGSSSSPITILLPNAIAKQAAEPFVVCLVGQQACSTLSALNHAYFTLLSAASNVLPTSTTIIVKSISAGNSGITTIGSMATVAPTCDFVIGPGSSTTARNLFPFFNYYNIPMIDFSSTDASLSSRISFSTYARVNPTDEYISKVAGSTFKKFGWPSVVIVTSQDSYGEQIVNSYTSGLGAMKVGVEISLMIPTNQLAVNDTVYRTLLKVKNELISRIVVLAISSTDDAHALFFQNIVDLGMTGTQIFWLSDSLCQFASVNPAVRYPLQNSMCASPQYDVNAYRQQYMQLFNSDNGQSAAVFRAGGFDISSCDLQTTDMYAPFASDAALAVLDVIKRLADSAGNDKAAMAAAQHNLTRLMDLVHSTHVMGITGIVAFDPVTGERTNAAYTVDMQQPNNQVTRFAQWNSGTGYVPVDLPAPLQWFANGTEVPKYTTRDIKFILVTTVTRNTASVVFSILGFIITVSIFCFCYKHYKLQKLVAGVQEQQQQQVGGVVGGQQSASVEMSQQANKNIVNSQFNGQTPVNQFYQGGSSNVEVRSQNNVW